jgi:predicted TIM-barrel fold metal-dependent hydrolase
VLVSNRDAASRAAGGPDVDEVEANRDCAAACAAHARLLPLYRARPGRLDSHYHTLAGALIEGPFLGAVFSCADLNETGEAALLHYLGALNRLAKPAFFHVRRQVRLSPARIYELARRHPRVPVVLCHAESADELRYQTRETLRSAVTQHDATILIDTSYFSAAEATAAVRDLGAAHILFGSDALALDEAHVPKVISVLDEVRRRLPAPEFKAWAGGNAARLLHLGRPAAAAT